ncbi:hypothetical protein NP233_g5119 [Leucocoprinus birnbaumii]|uniref:Uncharacterized protein n=1 Tax=Leucocoprinus birnbaumii TaxID=56174 RepID=A0AAD5VTX1_9AGAR|nr:hypothetical protein NP233_g5119 [Leucocoprinus birnbaumii]
MRYTSIVASIKTYLATLGDRAPLGTTAERDDADARDQSTIQIAEAIPHHLIPSMDDLHSSLKVLRYLQLPHIQQTVIQSDPTLNSSATMEGIERIMSLVQSQLDRHSAASRAGSNGSTPGPVDSERDTRGWDGIGARKTCYICRFFITSSHPLYPSVCHPCGEFNISSSKISLPPSLDLHGKTAAVTGGRINLGFHTALRLLRCGAHVIVTTRYPQDARTKYLEEKDHEEWDARLRIVGADFRSAKDVFDLVAEIKEILKTWDLAKLDILVNNAAQTLTDTLEKEQGNIRRERILLESSKVDVNRGNIQPLVAETQYQPRVRGGHDTHYITNEQTQRLVDDGSSPRAEEEHNSFQVTKAFKSSWVQGISDIPYEDVISAHSVNTFVPFILLRELLPLLKGSSSRTPHATRPVGYVINVSSREGIPERNAGAGAKSGHHVHTNMSKAALNMLTETEAAKTWKKDKIAINAVDPGYMSADPMWMEMVGRVGQDCPISWEDGAARILWPVAKGEVDNVAIWGKFLKHFTQIDVNRWG